MASVVLGLVEAGADGWTSPVTLGALGAGLLLLALVRPHRDSAPKSRSSRCGSSPTRRARPPTCPVGSIYAGMYGMFFFLGQFLQDVQGYSPLRAGICFLPIPISVFVSSQLVSKVLANRIRPEGR